MKIVLSVIFLFVLIYCSAQKMQFLDLKSALLEPQNVKSLYIDNYVEEKFDVNSLKIFINLNSLKLCNFSSKTDYGNLFDVLGELSQIDTLELSMCNLTAVPIQIGKLKFLTCLEISQCPRMTVISNELKQLKNLTCLDLSDNFSLTTIPDVFDSLENLKVLDLSNNKLTHLPQSICSLSKLEDLSLHYNKLISLPEEMSLLKQLKYLSLGNNPLTYLPVDFQQLSLEEIYLGENPFEVFPHQIFDISTLRKFGIYGIDLDSLPHSVSKLDNLESVSLRVNYKFNWQDAFVKLSENKKLTQLTICSYGGGNLPQEISLLKNIRILNVQGFANTSTAIDYFSSMTDLTELGLLFYEDTLLPSSIGALTNLKILKMVDCRLQALPSSIGQLVSLEELYLTKYGHDKELVIPSEIGELVNLRILDLSRCNIKELPSSIQYLTKLNELDLTSNDLTEIPKEISYLTSLETLSFYRNKITNIPDVFAQMNNLKTLYLSVNKIEKVPAAIWKLNALETLLLNDNSIVEFEIPDTVLTGIKELCLSENFNLKVLPDFFTHLKSLKRLDLECTQVDHLPDGLNKNLNLSKIELSENLINDKKALNERYGGIINFKGQCEALENINYHDLYGKITTDIKTRDDSITLYYYYSYNEPGKIDEEYDENVFFVLNKADMKQGAKFMLPNSFVRISVLHFSIWDALFPENKFKYKNLQGEISFLSVEKNKIKTYINLYCDGYDDTDRILIDHKTIVFKKK